MTPASPLRDTYTGWNGSAGHAAGAPIEAHVKVLCWSAACLADIAVTVMANSTQVARLEHQEVVVDVILLGGVWVDLHGVLAHPIPPGGILSLEVEASGVGPLMLLGHAGSDAPWVRID